MVMEGLAAGGKKMGKGMDEGKMLMKTKTETIVGILMADRTYSHMAHLKTSGYSAHMALGDFYESIGGFIDSFAEVAQGKFGKLDVPVSHVSTELNDSASALESSLEMIWKTADGCDNRALNAILDQIDELYLSTIYKIRELH